MYMKLLTVSKKWALACLLCIFSVYNTYAQYTEAALVGAITANTISLGNELSRTNSLQSATLGQNTVISGLLNDIQYYEEKMYNYMSEAQSIVTSAYTIVRCLRLGTDIIDELNQCRKAAIDHPQGLLVSSMITSQYSDVIQEASALVSYITPIVKGRGDNNLLNSAERIQILNSVSSRLYNLYSAVNQMKQNILRMRWAHFMRDISPELYYQFMNTENAYDATVKMISAAQKGL